MNNITKDGRTFRIDIEADDRNTPPWEDSDGHGVVSDWTSRDKKPGEMALNRHHGSYRYYDVQASIELALKDGWGIGPEELAAWTARAGRAPTKRQIAAAAVNRDFKFLYGWCNNEWCYVGVVVTDITDDENAEIDYGNALWGIESNEEKYHEEVANELIDNYLHEHADEFAAEARQAAARKAFDASVGAGAYDAYHALQAVLVRCVDTGLASTCHHHKTIEIYLVNKPEDA